MDKAELEETDKHYVNRLNEHVNFPNNDEFLKLFRQYRNKILKKQIAADDRDFRSKEFLETSYLQVQKITPDLDITAPAGAILFTKYVLGAVLQITAHREASMTFMLGIYEEALKSGPGKKSKPNLKLIK